MTASSLANDRVVTDNFTEGVFIDYKHFIAHNITPQFEFGFGLSYTTFDYSDLSISRTSVSCDMGVLRETGHGSDLMPEGGIPALWDIILNVSVMIQNSGKRDGAEVAQLYIGIPNGPLKQLRGFEKRHLAAGESQEFMFELTRRDLSTWEDDGWIIHRGSYHIYVGKSVLDIQLSSVITI